MRQRLIGLLLFLYVGVVTGIAASRLALTFRDGRVWLTAVNVPVTEILAEWSRVGHVRLVNGDTVSIRIVSLQLDGVLEDDALNQLLQSARGFVAVPRRISSETPATGASRFESIFIFASETAASDTTVKATANENGHPPPSIPPSAPSPVRAIPIAPGVQRLIGIDGRPVPDDQDEGPQFAPVPNPIYTPPGFATPPPPAPTRR